MPDIVEQTNTPTQPTQPAPPKNQSESKKAMNGIQGGLAFSIVLGIFTYLMYGAYQYLFGKVLFWTLLILTIIGILIAVSCLIDWKTAKKMEQIEEEAKREERELSEIGLDKRILRAEKLYKMNQKDLMRYYDANLAQTKFLSVLGNIMIILGLLIVLASLFLYIFVDADKLLLIVGNVSGIIVDFVGAVFVKMYTQNIKAAVKFHAKFAESNNLLLANSIAHKIDNPDLRERTLSEIAKNIAVRSDTE